MSHTLISRSGADRVRRNRKKLTGEVISIVIGFCDALAIVVMAGITGVAYHWIVYSSPGDVLSFLRVGAVLAAVVVISNLFRGEYQLSNLLSLTPHARRTAQLWNVTFVCLLIVGFVGKVTDFYSRGWFFLYYAAGLLTLLALRYAAVQLVHRSAAAQLISTKRVFLIGNAGEIERFLAAYEPRRGGIEIIGCRFLSETALSGTPIARQKALQRELVGILPSIRQLEPDAIFIITSWSDQAVIDGCIESLLTLPAEIHLGPGHALQKYSNAQLARLGPIASLQLVRLPLSRFELLQKRAFDLLLSTLGLVALAPLLAAVAVLVKLDSPGPIFFRQRRYGFNQKAFRIIKFRTMVTFDDGVVVPQATQDDPRVTRVGRWLRAWNLDELPQLINVVRGEMSLVGPRPHALSHNREYEHIIARYARRHNVKPGITGWAQVHGVRGETDTPDKMQKRVEYDLFYIENWSLARDIIILVWTVISPAAYRNAH
ncbi:MAG: exopolysaccharide biosynthesis polyprenyl glycosylphosphotransferase [Hyphomicrobium sp.]|nr:exopolysaccharide biosynthesis polyprenyl glycosylphosphotransferase [Hyphomicrobium sp.]